MGKRILDYGSDRGQAGIPRSGVLAAALAGIGFIVPAAIALAVCGGSIGLVGAVALATPPAASALVVVAFGRLGWVILRFDLRTALCVFGISTTPVFLATVLLFPVSIAAGYIIPQLSAGRSQMGIVVSGVMWTILYALMCLAVMIWLFHLSWLRALLISAILAVIHGTVVTVFLAAWYSR